MSETISNVDRIIQESAFAKIVETADGPAINIAGEIIQVRSASPEVHVEAIVRALRGRKQEGATSHQEGAIYLRANS